MGHRCGSNCRRKQSPSVAKHCPSCGSEANRRRRDNQRNLTENEVNGCLRNVLRDYNDRDVEAINRHLRGLRDALELQDGDVIPTLFGGSVSKHTYVDGLSDVDALCIINDSSLSGQSPRDVIRVMKERITRRMPDTTVSIGNLAVTVKYADGIEVQLLPAIRTKTGVRIAEPGTNTWSQVVHPERFARKLTQVNQANNGQVIPTVKLVKGLAAHTIRNDNDRISGYHLESLAIEAFRNYHKQYDLKSMVTHFNQFASKAVLRPITDPTGQSRHVDEYMGAASSGQRRRAAELFNQMQQELDQCKTNGDINNLFRL